MKLGTTHKNKVSAERAKNLNHGEGGGIISVKILEAIFI